VWLLPWRWMNTSANKGGMTPGDQIFTD